MSVRRLFQIRLGSGMRLALIALIAAHLGGRNSSAAPMQYTTDGWINITDDQGRPYLGTIPGQTPPIEFQGVQSGTFDGVHPFSLGQFVVPQGNSSNVTFNNVMAVIDFNIPSLHRFVPNPIPSGYPEATEYNGRFVVAGLLNGTIVSGAPRLTFTVTDVSLDAYIAHVPEYSYPSVLPFSLDDLNLPHSITIDSVGSDGLTAPLIAQVVPEPTTMALLLTAIVGMAVRTRRK